MLYTELVFRILSIITSILAGTLAYAEGPQAFLRLGMYVMLVYVFFLFFKRFLCTPGLHHVFRLTVEIVELLFILLLHWQTRQPLVFLLYLSYAVRTALVYPLRPTLGYFLLGALGFSFMAVLADGWRITGGMEDLPAYGYHLAILAMGAYLGRSVQVQYRRGQSKTRDMSNILAVKEKLITQLDESREMIREQNRQLSDIVRTDELTGLYTHRYLMDYLEYLFEYIKDSGDTVSLLMISVDRFKRINEKYGYASGDQILTSLAHIIRDNAGEDDIAVRYGGDEFVLVLPGQSREQAQMTAEAIRTDFMTARIEDGRMKEIDISIGIASSQHGADNREDILDAANRDMYIVKRNKVWATQD